jgi:hypothetical protein
VAQTGGVKYSADLNRRARGRNCLYVSIDSGDGAKAHACFARFDPTGQGAFALKCGTRFMLAYGQMPLGNGRRVALESKGQSTVGTLLSPSGGAKLKAPMFVVAVADYRAAGTLKIDGRAVTELGSRSQLCRGMYGIMGGQL